MDVVRSAAIKLKRLLDHGPADAEYTLAGKQQAAKRAARWRRRGYPIHTAPGHIVEKLKILGPNRGGI